MTAGQRKTAIVLGVWVGLQVVLGLGLLGWEFYSLTLGDHATITETTHVMWASQPWAFLLVGVVVTGIVAFLAGHFFGAPSGHYDEVRRRGFVVLLLAALASMAATCNRVGLPGTQGCAPDQYPVRIPCDDEQRGRGECVACIRVGTSPPSSIYPEVSPEPSSTPEPRPSPVPPSPSTHPPPSPESSPSPVATPKPPKPCKVDADKLPCWTVRNRLANDTRPGSDTGWTEVGNNFFKGVRGNVEFYVACEGRNPFARCWRAHADGRPAPELHQPDHGTIFGTWYPQGLYDAEKNPGGHPDHVGGGVCLQSYLDSLCPSPTPEPDPTPGPPVSPTPPPSGPNPKPTPATCPALVRWGGGLHAQMTPSFEGLPKEPFHAGNTADIDSTARFGGAAGSRGRPCNDEHHAVCEADGIDDGPNWRRCEDPRGPIFTVTSCGVDKVKVINGGWGLRLIGVHAGRCCVRLEPREDVQDHEGQPVRVLGDASTTACFEAR